MKSPEERAEDIIRFGAEDLILRHKQIATAIREAQLDAMDRRREEGKVRGMSANDAGNSLEKRLRVFKTIAKSLKQLDQHEREIILKTLSALFKVQL